MFLTKIWSVLVTLFAAAVTAAFLLATPPAETQLQEAYYQQLDGAQGIVDSHLRMESRRRLDFFNTVGQDYKIVKLLKLGKGKDETTGAAVGKQLGSYLHTKLKGGKQGESFAKKYTQVAFVDVDGKVWGRLGENEGKFGDSLRRFPGVKRALEQRVCSDNVLDIGGSLFFQWSCPVRYVKEGQKVELVGAVLAMKKIDDVFATSMLALIGETEGAEAAEAEKKKVEKGKKIEKGKKVEKGKKAAKAKKAKAKKAKAKKAKAKKAKAKKAKAKKAKLKINIAFFRKQKLMAKTSEVKLWAKAAGVYQKHKASVDNVAIGRSPAVELKDGGRRYLMVVGRLPGEASGGGNFWAILWQFPTRLGPMAFMDSKLPKKELFKYLPTVLFVILSILALGLTIFLIWFEGDRPISRLFNQAQELSLGKLEKLDDTQFRGKLGSIARLFNEGLETAVDAVPTKPALHDKDLDSILGGPDVATEDYTPPPAESVAKPTGSVLDGLGEPGAAGPPPPPADAGGGPPPPPPDLPPAGLPDPPGMSSGSESPLQPTPSGNFAFGVPSGSTPMALPGQGSAPPPPPQSTPAPALSPEAAAFREVFEQFVSTKKQCGESVEKLTFEAFSAKLVKNKQAVIDKTGCKDVTFRVYIKDGKAALKATPVKE